MYVIARAKDGYQAIPIRSGDSWEFYKLQAGSREQRIVLRVRGRRYLLFTTRELIQKYPRLGREQLVALCDEIIVQAQDRSRCTLNCKNMFRSSIFSGSETIS